MSDVWVVDFPIKPDETHAAQASYVFVWNMYVHTFLYFLKFIYLHFRSVKTSFKHATQQK